MPAAIVVLLCVLGWVLTSRRLARWSVTAPIVLTVAGLLLAAGPRPLVAINVQSETVRVLVEVTLALVLFGDASEVGYRRLATSWHWPARLLGIGLPLCVAAGLLVGGAFFPGTAVAVVAVIAASLAPTDAALGESIMRDTRISERVRETINIESGLNDGLATPVVLFFIALTAAEDTGAGLGHPVLTALTDLAIGVGVGFAFGWAGARLVAVARRTGWAVVDELPIAAICIALLSYGGAVAAGGNGFVGAFVGGLAFGGTMARRPASDVLGFTHRMALLLGFVVWFLFGAVLLHRALLGITWPMVGYAIASLTVIRMVPVALAMIGAGADSATVGLLGWLGPRGLASIVFAIISVEELPADQSGFVVAVVATTVAASVLLHGLTAGPLAGWYSRSHPTH